MKSVVAVVALFVAAGSYAGASERTPAHETAPAKVIAQFSQAIPPEPPVVGELRGQMPMASGARCCRRDAAKSSVVPQKSAGPCACCQKAPAHTHAKGK